MKAMEQTFCSLPEQTRTQMIALLSARLADTLHLSSYAKNAHWNYRGDYFIALHRLFDEIYEAVEKHVDEIAERIGALGGRADGSIATVQRLSTLPPYPMEAEGRQHVVAITEAMAAQASLLAQSIREAEGADDAATADLFTQILRETDKYRWFVESHFVDLA